MPVGWEGADSIRLASLMVLRKNIQGLLNDLVRAIQIRLRYDGVLEAWIGNRFGVNWCFRSPSPRIRVGLSCCPQIFFSD